MFLFALCSYHDYLYHVELDHITILSDYNIARHLNSYCLEDFQICSKHLDTVHSTTVCGGATGGVSKIFSIYMASFMERYIFSGNIMSLKLEANVEVL